MVNAEGKRFLDEGADFRNYTYAKYGRIVLQQPGSFAWQVFDAQVKHLLRDEYKLRGATKVQADTLEDLVEKMQDVHPMNFLDTVREYNAAIKRDVPFDPNVKDGRARSDSRSTRPIGRTPSRSPPFEAYSVGCGITFTFGGLKSIRNARARHGGRADSGPVCGRRARRRTLLLQLSGQHRTDGGLGVRPHRWTRSRGICEVEIVKREGISMLVSAR